MGKFIYFSSMALFCCTVCFAAIDDLSYEALSASSKVYEGVQITGKVFDESGVGVPDVMLMNDFDEENSVRTDQDGYYVLDPAGWDGTVTVWPSKEGLRFEPVSRQYSDFTIDQLGENYAAYNFLGPVPDVVGRSESEAVHILNEAGFMNIIQEYEYPMSIGSGSFSGQVIDQNPPPETLYPLEDTVTITVEIWPEYYVEIVGRVWDEEGNPMPGVTLTDHLQKSMVTLQDGRFRFDFRLSHGETFRITPSKTGFMFEPDFIREYVYGDNIFDGDFTAIREEEQPAPVAKFTVSPDTGIAPLEVFFDNQSENADRYQWVVYGEGDEPILFSEAERPSRTFESPGTYEIHLLAGNNQDDWSSYIQYVHVRAQQSTVPGNDKCANATSVATDRAVAGTNISATGAVLQRYPNSDVADVWYVWTADFSGEVFASVCNKVDFDTTLAVLTGCDGDVLVYNDDYCGKGSAVYFNAQEDTVYYFRVSGYDRAQGSFELLVTRAQQEAKVKAEFTATPYVGNAPLTVAFDEKSEAEGSDSVNSWYWDFGDGTTNESQNPPEKIYASPGTYTVRLTVKSVNGAMDWTSRTIQASGCGAPPSNDTCETAADVVADTPMDGTTRCAGEGDVWYRYVPVANGYATASLCIFADFDTILEIYPTCGLSVRDRLAYNDDHEDCGLASKVGFNVRAGSNYYLRVLGSEGAVGDFTLDVSFQTEAPPVIPAWERVGTNAGERTVRGQVINRISGNPIQNARVDITADSGDYKYALAVTSTDENGWFEFTNLPDAGPFEIGCRKDGFNSVEPRDGLNNIFEGDELLIRMLPRGITRPSVPHAVASPKAVYVDWEPNPEISIMGYNVYRTETDAEGTPLDGSEPEKLNCDPENCDMEDPYNGLLQTLDYQDETVPDGRYFVYQIQTISAAERPSALSKPSEPIRGKHLVIFFPDVSKQHNSLDLWQQDPAAPSDNRVRIPIASHCAYDLYTTGLFIDAELPARLLQESPLEIETSIITQKMDVVTTFVPGTDTHSLRMNGVDTEDRPLYGAGILFTLYMAPKTLPFSQQDYCDDLVLKEVRVYADPWTEPRMHYADKKNGVFCWSGGCLHGDADGDGKVTFDDQILIQRLENYEFLPPKEGGCYPEAWDINRDGYVDLADATLIKRYLEGKPINPPGSAKMLDLAQESFTAAGIVQGQKLDGASPTVWIEPPSNIAGEFTASVFVEGAAPLAGWTITLAYDKSVLTFNHAALAQEIAGNDYDFEYNEASIGKGGSGLVHATAVSLTSIAKSDTTRIMVFSFTTKEQSQKDEYAASQSAVPFTLTKFQPVDAYGYAPRHTDPMKTLIVTKGPGDATLLGDVDQNGQVNTYDALAIFAFDNYFSRDISRLNAARGTGFEVDLACGDVTGDGQVDTYDALAIFAFDNYFSRDISRLNAARGVDAEVHIGEPCN